MAVEPTITCPSCRTEIKLTESLAAPLIEVTRKQYESKLAQQSADFAKREDGVKALEAAIAKDRESLDAAVAEKVKAEREKLAAEAVKREKVFKDKETALAKEKESLDAAVAEKLKAGRATIASEEAKKARVALGNDLEQRTKEVAELNEVIKLRDEKLAEAQKAQAELVRKQRELDDAKREMDLTIEKRVTESLGKVREIAKKDAEQELSLKVIEKDLTIKSMMEEIESLKRKAEQSSQQLQGEALEWQLETLLREKFLHDSIDPVPKGEHGGDILHRVNLPTGTLCGTILWETKRVKNWQDGWLPISRDRYLKRDELGVIYQLCVSPGEQRKLVGAALVQAVFERSAYGCKLFCCWCAQDLAANRFWESLGFVPIAFRGGSEKKGKKDPSTGRRAGRVHIFWQKRIRLGDTTTPWWFPIKTESGALRADRLVLPIPRGMRWWEEMPVMAGEDRGSGVGCRVSGEEKKRRLSSSTRTPKPEARNPRSVQFGRPGAVMPTAEKPPAPPVEREKRPKREKPKCDPKLVQIARELRDRWLEQVNADPLMLVSAGKYEVGKPSPAGLLPPPAGVPGERKSLLPAA